MISDDAFDNEGDISGKRRLRSSIDCVQLELDPSVATTAIIVAGITGALQRLARADVLKVGPRGKASEMVDTVKSPAAFAPGMLVS